MGMRKMGIVWGQCELKQEAIADVHEKEIVSTYPLSSLLRKVTLSQNTSPRLITQMGRYEPACEVLVK